MGTIADFAIKSVLLQTPLQTSVVLENVFAWTGSDPLNEN